MKRAAVAFLLAVFFASVGARWIAPYGFQEQRRDEAGLAPAWTTRAGVPGAKHWLGTDELGRDRFSRLLYGARVSLLVAPAAALLATAIAAAAGMSAAYFGGACQWTLLLVTDVFLGLPWIFLLLVVRAVLPLNVGAMESLAVTLLLLGGLGWPGAARVVRASCVQLRASNFALQAEAGGLSPARLLLRHMVPGLRPIVVTQFLVSVPAFLLAEANLGMLGLGVTEPLPSLGNLLAEMATLPSLRPSSWGTAGIVAPGLLLIAVLAAFHLAHPAVRNQRSPS